MFAVAAVTAPMFAHASTVFPTVAPIAIAVSATSVTFDLPFNPTLPTVDTTNCWIAYGAKRPYTNRIAMKRGSAGFTVTIPALPPGSLLSYRAVCDRREGADAWLVTPSSTSALPFVPSITKAALVGSSASFAFATDPSAPTVYWLEVDRGIGFVPFETGDATTTTASGGTALSGLKLKIRLGVRNSAGSAYSSTVTVP